MYTVSQDGTFFQYSSNSTIRNCKRVQVVELQLLATYLQWAEVLVLKGQYIFPLYLMKNLKFKTLKMPLSLKIQKMAAILHQLSNNEKEQLVLQRLI